MKATNKAILLAALAVSGCALEAGPEGLGAEGEALAGARSELGRGHDNHRASPNALAARGRRLYDRETFAGNGRTCTTCHGKRTGTISPAEAQALYAADPHAPLFRPIDSDDGAGESYRRLLEHATIRVELPLPETVYLADDPDAVSVVVHRGIPTTMNTPALDPVLMLDGRAPDLASQAVDAIFGHAQAGRAPDDSEIDAIVAFETSDRRFFSSPTLRDYANGGPPPQLPLGTTESERRGRAFFVEGGRCARCHGGPMLDSSRSGRRFSSAGVSEHNLLNNPVYRFVFTGADGEEVVIESPDPGHALITGDPRDANRFKISPLWGVSRTAPYFHDNSAATLEEVAAHYDEHFRSRGHEGLTDQEQADIVAYMRLL